MFEKSQDQQSHLRVGTLPRQYWHCLHELGCPGNEHDRPFRRRKLTVCPNMPETHFLYRRRKIECMHTRTYYQHYKEVLYKQKYWQWTLIWQFDDRVKIAKLTYVIIDPFILQAWVSLHTALKITNLKSCQQCCLSIPPNIMFTNNSAYTVLVQWLVDYTRTCRHFS